MNLQSALTGVDLWRARQAALVDFSIEAIRAPSLDAVLEQACLQVARGLRLPIAKVLQVQPGRDKLLLRAAVGLPRDVAIPSITEVPSGTGSEAGYALQQDEPVVSSVATEFRFEVSHIVRAAGARVSANVVIPLRDGPFGTLEVDDIAERVFTIDDIDFLRIYATLLGAAVERQRAAAAVAMMFDELQHRVKNDLQLMAALLALESRQTANEETRHRLRSVSSRIHSLQAVHEQLYTAGAFTTETVALHTYLGHLVEQRFGTYGAQARRVRLALQLAPAYVGRDQAVALGLIANEFLTNSLKHAFPDDRAGAVMVDLAPAADGHFRLRLADDGIGMDARAGAGADRGLGLDIIAALAQQLNGSLAWGNDVGTSLILTFPANP